MGKGLSWPVVSGPLAGRAGAYREELARLGYAPSAASEHMFLMADVSRWLDLRGLPAEAFGAVRVDEYLAGPRAAGRVRGRTRRGLIPLLGYLRSCGVAGEPEAPAAVNPVDRLVEDFAGYLVSARGLSPGTVAGYRRVARRFLQGHAPDPGVDGCGVAGLGAGNVSAFLLLDTAGRAAGSAANVTTALRAFLGFCYVRGLTAACLGPAVPRGAGWRGGGRAEDLPAGTVSLLLAGCDRGTAAGRRDFAILTVLSRLGLRAGEVAGLGLDDLDWAAGEVRVRGKGGRVDRLPLPVDVGQALADYCRRGRPATGHRVVFLNCRAPHGPLSPRGVSRIVASACRRAGVPAVGAHRLRHASARAMRRAGAPLLEIGQVMRHRWAATTAIYAKDDLEALAGIARPWPAGLS